MLQVMQAIKSAGGMPYIVGGYVRDAIMGHKPKDMDIEVFNISAQALVNVLIDFGKVDQVGASFGVIKLTTADGGDYDFSLPRRDNKTGQGNRGFIVDIDPTMNISEAAARRDFTMNAISMTIDGEIVDPHNGKADISAGILRHTSVSFAEDPLRVLRGMQFSGRYNLSGHKATVKLCRQLRGEYCALPKERIWAEWYKWAAKSLRPSAGLEFLYRTGWVNFYPEIKALIGLKQEPDWHPEGSVYIHSKHVCDAATDIAVRDGLSETDRAMFVFGALCHDFGKATTTKVISGKITSHGHDEAGVEPTISFMKSIGAPEIFVKGVAEYTRFHMRHVHGEPSERVARRLIAALQVIGYRDVLRIMEADHAGRPPLPKQVPESVIRLGDFMEKVSDQIKPLLMGRHLIEMGVKPGPAIGVICRAVYEMQLNGDVRDLDQALIVARSML